jgi:hypothetical protein
LAFGTFTQQILAIESRLVTSNDPRALPGHLLRSNYGVNYTGTGISSGEHCNPQILYIMCTNFTVMIRDTVHIRREGSYH